MENTNAPPQASGDAEVEEFRKALEAFKESVKANACDELNPKIEVVLQKARPIQNLLTRGDLKETDEKLTNLKANLRLTTQNAARACQSSKSNTQKNTKKNTKKTTNTNTNTKNKSLLNKGMNLLNQTALGSELLSKGTNLIKKGALKNLVQGKVPTNLLSKGATNNAAAANAPAPANNAPAAPANNAPAAPANAPQTGGKRRTRTERARKHKKKSLRRTR